MAVSHTIVDMAGHTPEGFAFTFNISGVVVAADVGKPVTLDTTAANTMKLAGDGDSIDGRLETLEVRAAGKVGTVSTKFIQKFTVKAADLLAVGDTAVGAPSGEVKKAGANNKALNYVVALSGGVATIAKL